MDNFRRGAFEFPVEDSGPSGGDVVVLLHGFPQTRSSWDRVVPGLAAAGYRCLVPDQRGYAPGARPRGRKAYRVGEMVADVEALLDASATRRVHLVGHDWGALVAWALAARQPGRIATLTALSVPHPAAFAKAIVRSRQAFASWYIYAFQLPLLPEQFLKLSGGDRFASLLRRSGQTPALAARDAHVMIESGALTGALNWYRAIPFGIRHRHAPRAVRVPTLYIWSDGDTAVLRPAAERCGDYVRGPYRFEVLAGVSHWIPEAAPAEVTQLLTGHFAEHPIEDRG